MRLVQTYAGYDVFGSSAEAEMDLQENYSGQMLGEIVRDLQSQIPNPEACQRKVTSLQNLAIRLKRLNPRDRNVVNRDARRIIFASPELRKAKLAYRIEFLYMKEDYITKPVYFFDACTGLVLLTYDQIQNATIQIDRKRQIKWDDFISDNMMLDKFEKALEDVGISNNSSGKSLVESTFQSKTGSAVGDACPVSVAGVGGNEKIGQIVYNRQPYCLNVQKIGISCRMEGTYSKVIDNEFSFFRRKQTVIQFNCFNGYQDSINGGYGIANDAMYYGEICGQFFQENFGFRALDYKPRLVVHFGYLYQNAIFDGRDMYFGDGGSLVYPFVDLGVMSHELAHGVTVTNSNLVYEGMSGGINEAFSDITAETTEYYARNSYDWKVGSDIVKPGFPGTALRYFDDPTQDGRSIRYAILFRSGMDVHYSSGVFNHAFYRMVEKERMDIMDAYKCFLDANLNLWSPFTNFYNGACNVMQAAYENGFSHRKVRRAFWRVGIPLIFCRFAALGSSMLPGEARENVMVSAKRSPIIRLDLDSRAGNATVLEAYASDNSRVRIALGSDNEVENIISVGDNTIAIPNAYKMIYAKLISDSTTDVKIDLKLL